MIHIINKSLCCGCHACYNICPKRCIGMIEDCEGFLYPKIKMENCIECNLCETVCPLINRRIETIHPLIWACRAKNNENRLKSSSGGMFGLLAEEVISNDGTIVAARFDDQNNVIHDLTRNISALDNFKRSKYVQSAIGENFRIIKELLKKRTTVLFVGTPCQVSGLLKFLQSPYKNLYTVDFVCHGVPSPKVWRKYIETLGENISNINFRDKSTGWASYSFSYIKNDSKISMKAEKNPFLKGFLHDLFLRPSCHTCQFKDFSSGSDLTLSDFWGLWKNKPEWNDNKGASCIAINSDKGKELLSTLNTAKYEKTEITYKKAYIDYNNSARIAAKQTPKRDLFFSRFENENFETLVQELSKDTNIKIIKNYLHRIKMQIKKR